MISKKIVRLATSGLLLTSLPMMAVAQESAESRAALAEMPADVRAKTLEFEKSLHPSGGSVSVPGAHASLELGDRYYFLPAADAKRVLTEAWGNSPDAVTNVLGMIFPKGRTFYDGTWGAVIEFEDTGHIDDKDAADQDYDQVLADMKAGEEEANKAAREAGYAGATLMGWAQPPTYDSATKTLIWARNIKFDGNDGNTLNYDVRKLSRTGVLSMNMVDSMDNLALVRSAAGELGKTVQLSAGQRYADFNPGTDASADYGLAGLVAAGAGVAVAKKTGLLAILLLVLKKGFVFVLAGAGAAWAWFKRKTGKTEEAEAEVYETAAEAPSPDSEHPIESETRA